MWHKIICNQAWSETETAAPEDPGKLAEALFSLIERDGLDKASDTLAAQISWKEIDPGQPASSPADGDTPADQNAKVRLIEGYGTCYTDLADASECDYDYIWGIMTDGAILGTRCADGATCALTTANKDEKDFSALFD